VASVARAEVLQYQVGKSTVRPYLFVDDNKWEALDRTQVLPSQNRKVGDSVPNDARLYLLRDKVKPVGNGDLQAVYTGTVEEILNNQFLPAFSKLGRMDLSTGEAPMTVLTGVLKTAADQMRQALPQIEQALALPSGARQIVFMIAPWDKAPYNEAGSISAYQREERYAPRQMGFSSLWRTPTRDWAAKNWIYDEQAGEAISTGLMGNLGARVQEIAQRQCAIVLEQPYAETPHQVPPYVYPVAILIRLKVQPGASSLKIQALLGLQPMLQALDPPNKAPMAEIVNAGVPQAAGLTEDDSNWNYPLTLVTFEQPLAQALSQVRLHFDFGIWSQYHHFRRAIELTRDNSAWRMTPYLGGDLVKGNVNSYWTHLRVPVRIHMTQFDVVNSVSAADAHMENLKTAIEIFDRQGGKLIPFATGINIGITNGSPTDQAATQIQQSVNDMITKAFADARKGAREAALKKFPLAALFLDK
jgi:hypothetical protein